MVRELKNKIKNTGKLSPALKELAELDNSIYKTMGEFTKQLSEQMSEELKPVRESAKKLVDYIEDSYKPLFIQANQISKLLSSFAWPSDINPTKEELEKSIDSIVSDVENKPISPERTELANVLKEIEIDETGATKEKVSLERAREILRTKNPNITDEEVSESLVFWETLVDKMIPKILNMRKGIIS